MPNEDRSWQVSPGTESTLNPGAALPTILGRAVVVLSPVYGVGVEARSGAVNLLKLGEHLLGSVGRPAGIAGVPLRALRSLGAGGTLVTLRALLTLRTGSALQAGRPSDRALEVLLVRLLSFTSLPVRLLFRTSPLSMSDCAVTVPAASRSATTAVLRTHFAYFMILLWRPPVARRL